MENKDQIFIDAVKTCRETITRKFISEIILNDKTNTIRKYMNSYGMLQLAFHLRDLGANLIPPHVVSIHIDDAVDKSQRKVQDREKGHQRMRASLYSSPLDDAHAALKKKKIYGKKSSYAKPKLKLPVNYAAVYGSPDGGLMPIETQEYTYTVKIGTDTFTHVSHGDTLTVNLEGGKLNVDVSTDGDAPANDE